MDRQEFILPLDDANRPPKSAEQRQPAVEGNAGARDHPEHPAL
jgi:hypothetical protein